MEPIVIDPPGFDVDAAWKAYQDYVDEHGGMVHPDGSTNWRSAFGADPGVVSCPCCGEMFWAFGTRQRCRKCGTEYPVNWWPMYSWGVQAAWATAEGYRRTGSHDKRMAHPYYRHGFNHPPAKSVDLHKYAGSIDWKRVLAEEEAAGGA